MKLLFVFILFGFVVVGILLFINHAGFTIKVTNYLFIALLIVVTYETFNKN